MLGRQQPLTVAEIELDPRLREIGVVQKLLVDNASVCIVTDHGASGVVPHRRRPELTFFCTDLGFIDVCDADDVQEPIGSGNVYDVFDALRELDVASRPISVKALRAGVLQERQQVLISQSTDRWSK